MQATQKGDPATPRQPRLTDKNYRMSKANKRILTTYVDPVARAHYKHMIIDAHVTALKHAAESAKKRDKKSTSRLQDGE